LILLEEEKEETLEINQEPLETSNEVSLQSSAPLSAIAARRAAINAGLYNPEPIDHSEEEQDEEEDIHLKHSAEGIEIQSVTDEEDEALRNELGEGRVMSPISGTTTPNGGETPTPLRSLTPMIMETSKTKNKM
jgi:hypothetical protein